MARLPLSIGWLVVMGAAFVAAQAPPTIQFFMPGGALPARELRFTLTRADGRQEFLFTDTKGKFQLSSDLVREGDYTIYLEGDQRSFETTVHRFRIVRGISYIPVFLLPLKSAAPPKPATIDIAEYDAKVPADARTAYDLAMKFVNENNVEGATSEFTRALALHPQYLRALNDLGVLYLKLNRLDEAAATFTQAVSFNSRFHLPRLNLGLVRVKQGRFDEAIKVFNQLLKDQPTLTQARLPFADALSGAQQWDAAAEQLRLAAKDESLDRQTRGEAHTKLGMLLNREERYEAAAAELSQAIKLAPESASAHLYLGAALIQLKKLPEAERTLLKAYELGGAQTGSAQLLLGQLYYQQQKYEAALRAFEKFLQDVPSAPNAAQIKEVVEKIKTALKAK